MGGGFHRACCCVVPGYPCALCSGNTPSVYNYSVSGYTWCQCWPNTPAGGTWLRFGSWEVPPYGELHQVGPSIPCSWTPLVPPRVMIEEWQVTIDDCSISCVTKIKEAQQNVDCSLGMWTTYYGTGFHAGLTSAGYNLWMFDGFLATTNCWADHAIPNLYTGIPDPDCGMTVPWSCTWTWPNPPISHNVHMLGGTFSISLPSKSRAALPPPMPAPTQEFSPLSPDSEIPYIEQVRQRLVVCANCIHWKMFKIKGDDGPECGHSTCELVGSPCRHKGLVSNPGSSCPTGRWGPVALPQ